MQIQLGLYRRLLCFRICSTILNISVRLFVNAKVSQVDESLL